MWQDAGMASAILVALITLFTLFILGVAWAMNSRWAGERGWVFNRYNPRTRGPGSLGLLETLFEPSIEHVVEERSSERARGTQDQSGAPPEPGPGDGP
jgi:hypothetical protein